MIEWRNIELYKLEDRLNGRARRSWNRKELMRLGKWESVFLLGIKNE